MSSIEKPISETQTETDIFWVHLARAFAIVAVVLIHAGADLLHAFGQAPMGSWWAANIYVSLGRVSVPLFFMLSGFLLLGRSESLTELFQKRVLKILWPLIFWSLVYLLWRLWLFHPQMDLLAAIARLPRDLAFPHLWFLYAMLAVYLAYPIMRPFVQHTTWQVQTYYVLVWIAALLAAPLAQSAPQFALHSDFLDNIGLFSGYLGYSLTGYLLGRLPINGRLAAAMLPVILIAPIFTILRTFIYSQAAGEANIAAQYYLGPTVLFAALSSFYWLRLAGSYGSQRLSPHLRTVIRELSRESYGIYLVHMLIITLLASGKLGFELSAFSLNAWWAIPLVTLLSVLFSYGLVVVLKQSRLGRAILP